MHTPKVIIHRLQIPGPRRSVRPSRILRAAAALACCAAVLTTFVSL